ncbi:hypothetical protein P175DRAFT_0529379 [Aspergillus ochraceoroseus IBT 24754]|uniref:Uncharacterized protein n=1 Tax=Aspergillus ochraceoroseus IBT 24754 TaxID=1392256 RepID=A0A2T5M1C7_9EURO|nr:uncharacterized protein P175DRAFT_0529379 [Aspergillus ochraceoroseus IBT 24754]PTU22329.1 hypothetical protein P175DRAFT_0529379 [Aspergillus ochraceoroseus IBT 24754]
MDDDLIISRILSQMQSLTFYLYSVENHSAGLKGKRVPTDLGLRSYCEGYGNSRKAVNWGLLTSKKQLDTPNQWYTTFFDPANAGSRFRYRQSIGANVTIQKSTSMGPIVLLFAGFPASDSLRFLPFNPLITMPTELPSLPHVRPRRPLSAQGSFIAPPWIQDSSEESDDSGAG